MIPRVTSSAELNSDSVSTLSYHQAAVHGSQDFEAGNQITAHYDRTSLGFPWMKPIQTEAPCINFKKGGKKEITHTLTGALLLQQCSKATRFYFS